MSKQFLKLIEQGVFQLNDTVTTRYKKNIYTGKIVATGISYNNIIYESPSGFAAYTRNNHIDNRGRKKSLQCNGWTSVFYKGKKLSEYKCKDTCTDGGTKTAKQQMEEREAAKQRELEVKQQREAAQQREREIKQQREAAKQRELEVKQQREAAQQREPLTRPVKTNSNKRGNPPEASSSQPVQKKQKHTDDTPLMTAIKLATAKHKNAGKILFKYGDNAICFYVKSHKRIAYVVASAILRAGKLPGLTKFHNANKDKYKNVLNHNTRAQTNVIDRFRRQMDYKLLFVEPTGTTDMLMEVDLFTKTTSEYFTNDISRYFHLKRVTLGSDATNAIAIA